MRCSPRLDATRTRRHQPRYAGYANENRSNGDLSFLSHCYWVSPTSCKTLALTHLLGAHCPPWVLAHLCAALVRATRAPRKPVSSLPFDSIAGSHAPISMRHTPRSARRLLRATRAPRNSIVRDSLKSLPGIFPEFRKSHSLRVCALRPSLTLCVVAHLSGPHPRFHTQGVQCDVRVQTLLSAYDARLAKFDHSLSLQHPDATLALSSTHLDATRITKRIAEMQIPKRVSLPCSKPCVVSSGYSRSVSECAWTATHRQTSVRFPPSQPQTN